MFFFFKQKTAYEMRISDWSSDVCSSDLEIELLQKLSARREAIEKRERELDMREALAAAAEARLVAKTAELDRLQKSIEALARAHDEQEAAKIESLVTIYEKMKPRDAARILQGLEMAILIDVQIGRAACREIGCQYG